MMFWWPASPVVIDAATLADVDDIADLHAGAFHRGWSAAEIEALLAQDSVIALAARRASPLGTRRVVGFLMIRVAGDEAEVLTIAVSARQRRRGLGRRLMDAAMRRLYHDRVHALFLEVDEANAAARGLYARLGFREVGRRRNYYTPTTGGAASALILRADF
ncbi:MAG TPA: ribosomal protein S18-alanine N-acetyltransferase [Methylomirabilota bacterium]|nr:ribosomal protein S18-alanine N-acetyltransferase [Methylomirabilota bacterium]